MSKLADRNVQHLTKIAENQELLVEFPPSVFRGLSSPKEIIGFAYHKDSANPVNIKLSISLNNQIVYNVREVNNFTGFDFYFQLEVPLPADFKAKFETVGALGGGFRHHVSLFYR